MRSLQHYTSFDDKAKYIIKDKRHSLRLKCKSCNYKVKIGGIKSLRQLDVIFDEIRDEHKCKSNWIIERDFHASEIPHTYVEQTTKQTHTGDTNWTDISGASISSGSFTTGRKYLLIFQAEITGSNTFSNFSVKSLHGSTDFTSAMNLEVQSPDVYYPYTWFTVWTAIDSEGIKMQFKTDSSAQTVKADQISITSVEISEDLSENTDWFFATRTASDTLSTSFTATNPSVTISTNGTDDWLIITVSQINPASNTVNYESRINLDGSTLTPLHSQEGEDTTNDLQMHFLTRVYTPDNNSHTFTSDARVDSGTAGTREHSSIFALNLNKFDVHADSYIALDSSQDSNDTLATSPTQENTATIVPNGLGDVFIMSFMIFDSDTIIKDTKIRQQVSNSDQPPSQTSDDYSHLMTYDETDQLSWNIITMESLSSSTVIDMDSSNDAGNYNLRDLQIVAFTMELASVGFPHSFGIII